MEPLTPLELTNVERQIIRILRTLPPYGKVEITADKEGKYGTFLVHKSEKIVLSLTNNLNQGMGG